MKPTEENLQKIRELLVDAGSASELRRWIQEAQKKPPGKKGRPRGDKWQELDFWLLREIDQRHAMAPDPQKSVTELITEAVNEKWQAGQRMGASKKAAVRRIFSRLRPLEIKDKIKGETRKITLSKPEFDFSLARRVQPRAKGGRTRPLVNFSFASGFILPFRYVAGRIKRDPPVYQPGSVEYEEQRRAQAAKATAKKSS